MLFNVFQFLALANTSATNVGLISTLNVFSISAFSYLFLQERINILQKSSMVFSLLGVLLVISKGDVYQMLSLRFNVGDLWMLIAVCVFGIYSVFSKWPMLKTSPMMSTLYSGIFGLIILIPFNVYNFTIYNLNGPFIESILYTGVISTVIGMVLWNIGIQKLGATNSGIFLNFNPIFTALLAFLLLGEDMTWIQIIGGGIVIVYSFSRFKKINIGTITRRSQEFVD